MRSCTLICGGIALAVFSLGWWSQDDRIEPLLPYIFLIGGVFIAWGFIIVMEEIKP